MRLLTIRLITLGIGALASLSAVGPLSAQETNRKADYPPKMDGAQEHVYRQADGEPLKLWSFSPKEHRAEDARPAILFFFGGGWTGGTPKQFEQQCRYLASRGMVAMTADYRVASRQKVKAIDCVDDAFHAMRWVRDHAKELGIHPDKIAVGGGSAGGHLAACLATVEDPKQESGDSKTTALPNAMVLFNPALALAEFPGMRVSNPNKVETLEARMGIQPQRLSPAHHVKKGIPPSIVFFGTDDDLLQGAEYMQKQVEGVEGKMVLKTYSGEKHGFFNYGRGNQEYFKKTLTEADQFLVSLGWLEGMPQVDAFFGGKGK